MARVPRSVFSREFKLTLAGIGAIVLTAVLFPDWASSWRDLTGNNMPYSSSPIVLIPPRAAEQRSPVQAVTPSSPPPPSTRPAPNPGREIPELPPLSEATATPTLLSYAERLAREHPDETWLRQYVVNAHFWLVMHRIDEGRYQDALGYLEASEAWGAPGEEVAMYRAIVYREEDRWELAEQWARTAIAQGSTTDPAEMHHIIGKAMYFREELDWAIEEFERALEIRESPEIRASWERAMRDARTSEGFSRRRLSHFIVRYEGETMEETGRMAIDTLERNYASLVSQLGFEPKEPVAVILYTRRSYREVTGGDPHPSAGKFDGKIRLPVRDIPWNEEYIQDTLHHELSHAFFYSRTGGHDPRWLNEGLAEYVEGERTRDVGDRLAPSLRDGGTLDRCLLTTIYNCSVFYPAATSVVDYMIQLRGMGGIRDVVTDLGRGNSVDSTLRRIYGRDEHGLIADWERFVRGRHP